MNSVSVVMSMIRQRVMNKRALYLEPHSKIFQATDSAHYAWKERKYLWLSPDHIIYIKAKNLGGSP